MKKISKLIGVTTALGLGLSMSFANITFAAFNDVVLNTSTIINVAGFNLTVSGSAANLESLTVGANNFSVGLLAGSSLTITTPASVGLSLSPDSGPFSVSNTCTSSGTTLVITSITMVGITITPTSTPCSPPVMSSGSNSGSSYVNPPQVVVNVPSVPNIPTPTNPQINQVLKGFVFDRNLKLGSKGEDVRQLQIILNKNGFEISASGPGSIGYELDYFGKKTKKAVQKFQTANNLLSSKDRSYGNVGPKTRAKLQELIGN